MQYLREYSVGAQHYYVTYSQQGNNQKGDKIYIVNVFNEDKENVNDCCSVFKLDKHGNIKISSYNIKDTIMYILESMTSPCHEEVY